MYKICSSYLYSYIYKIWNNERRQRHYEQQWDFLPEYPKIYCLHHNNRSMDNNDNQNNNNNNIGLMAIQNYAQTGKHEAEREKKTWKMLLPNWVA